MYNDNAKKRTMKYLAKLKEVRFRVKPEEYEEMQRFAEQEGYTSMRQFFIAAIHKMMYNEDVEKCEKLDGIGMERRDGHE